MSDLWEQAQAAIEEGDTRQAHVYLAKLLKQEPRNSDAWYLLSSIVPSTEQKKLFLNKVLKIEPAHDQAISDLAALDARITPAVPISSEPDDYKAQAMGDTMPDWMADEPSAVIDEMQLESPMAEPITPAMPISAEIEENVIPDWLKEDTEGWGEEIEDELESASELVLEPAEENPATSVVKAKAVVPLLSRPRLPLTLILLIFAAVVVFILLVISIINTLAL